MEAKQAPRHLPVSRVYEVRDDSWMTLAACTIIVIALGGAAYAYLRWKQIPLPPVVSLASAESPARLPDGQGAAPHAAPVAPSLPTAASPVAWNDLTLMLRTGLRDDEIIAVMTSKQLVTWIGPTQANMLRQLGAGDRLVRYLQSRPLYAPAPVVARTANFAPPVLPRPYFTAPAPQPVDYAAKDRQIQSLKARIDAMDDEMRCIRTNPDRNPYRINYRMGSGEYSSLPTLEEYLDKLDQQRNDLRRQKWQLEGR